MRGKNLVQLIKTLSFLSRPQGATKKEMALGLAISIRSVSRSIQVIEELGIPVYDERPLFEKEKRWRIESAYLTRMPNVDLLKPWGRKTMPEKKISLEYSRNPY